MPAAKLTPAPSMALQLDGARDRLDRLIGEVDGGVRGAVRFDELEAEANAICGVIRSAFRGGVR